VLAEKYQTAVERNTALQAGVLRPQPGKGELLSGKFLQRTCFHFQWEENGKHRENDKYDLTEL
jgi:hypothetical protein